jgi:subtilisin family serine protease
MITRMHSIAVAAGLTLGLALSSVAVAERPGFDVQDLQPAQVKRSEKWVRPPNATEPDTGGEHRYIVQFDEDALPLYDGGINGLAATSVGPGQRLDPRSAAAAAYVNHLQQTQNQMIANMTAKVGSIQVERRYQHALNAVTVRMTEREANKVRSMPGVRFVERDRQVTPTTATSVSFIGADQVWEGASGGIPYLGEGMVVGIIDSGINHEHPSFAATGDDGYTHTNPLGSGTYLGECLDFPGLCNDKLIGAYTFLNSQSSTPPDEILIDGDAPSSDTDGHGTHVASTAAGNILYDIALPDADGNPSSVVFPRVSGVAPHANVIAYKVCAPSCFFSDIAAAVDQAIADGIVDALNHSIGSSSGNPWNSTQAQAFLAARAAGIFVSNSAGNSGPDAGTAEAAGNAPWVAGVAATTHDRSYPTKLITGMTGGDTAAPADIVGRSISGSITGDIVYAGNFPTPDDGDDTTFNDVEPEQCLEPFPAGTFTANQIVVCDRGTIARVAKGQHVRDGGAGGLILANIDGGATSVVDDPHVIPAIHVNSADGNVLRAWLASGTGHAGTITAVDAPITDPAAGDNVADFSSRGPYTGFDILAPNTAAPGVSILAAGAELTQGQIDLIHELYDPTAWESVPGSFGQIGGTSMASPHITGSAALLKQAHPDWTDAEVLSAIMTTGSHDLVKEDGVTPADIHDIGGGRVQLVAAVNAGLVLDESVSAFQAANPDQGGEPSALNVAALVQDECVQACTWTRTVRATTGGTWTTSGLDAFVSVSPESFTLAAGETQEIVVTVDATTLQSDAWSFSRAVLTPSDSSIPTTQLPITVVAVSGVLPASVNIDASRDAGSLLFQDITATALTGFNVKIFEPTLVEGMQYSLPGDSDNSDVFDDITDGAMYVLHDVPAGTQRAVFEILDSESPDLDLFVGLVLDPDNPVDPGLLACVSATGTALESCDLDADYLDFLRSLFGPDLTFFVLVQNWQPSAEGAVDAFTLATTNVGDTETSSLYAEGPAGSLDPLVPFDVRFYWDMRSETGDSYLSATEWYADAAQTQLLGKAPLQFNRGVDDVTFASSADGPVNAGDVVTFTATIQPNFTPEDRTYKITVPKPSMMNVDPESITNGGYMVGNTVVWEVTRESLLGQDGEYLVSTNLDNPEYCAAPFGGTYIDLAGFGIGPDPSFTGDNIAGTFFSGQNPIPFFNGTRDGGLTVTDDGFGFFESTPGPNPYINTPIPVDSDPNDMLAPFWSDWVINYDDGSGGRVRGVSAATAGADLSIVEWDGVEYWPGDGGYPISGDFEIIMFGTVDPDFPEFIFGYNGLDTEFNDLLLSLGYITSGVENRTGTIGTEYTGAYSDGLLVCYDYVAPDSAPTELSFSATVKANAGGRTFRVSQRDVVDNPGSRPNRNRIQIEVNEPPYIFRGFFGLTDGMTIDASRIRALPVSFMLFDPATLRPVRKAKADIVVTDAGDNIVSQGSARYLWFFYYYRWTLGNVASGEYTITANLDDGSSNSITVTLSGGTSSVNPSATATTTSAGSSEGLTSAPVSSSGRGTTNRMLKER